MFKGILAVLFAVLFLQCVLSKGAAAQVGNSCPIRFFSCGQYSLWDATCVPAEPWGAWDCFGFWFSVYCKLPPLCPPPDGPQGCGGCATTRATSPINLAIGNTYIEETDVRLPGLGGGLTLARTWNSMWPATLSAYQIGLFGPNWRSNFEERLFVGSDHYLKYARGDGSFWSLTYINSNGGTTNYTVVAPANVSATLSSGSSYWKLTFQNGEQRLFDNVSGKLTAIIDRNGNTTQLTYDSLVRLVTVTDPASRHLYFGYGSGSYLVASVTSDFGESATYSYDIQGRLSQVTQPDGSTLSFQYDSNSFVSAVVDSNGKILEAHTYDSSGRGLTSSRANGVDAVTISYGNP